MRNHYAICKNEDGQTEVWGGPCMSYDNALYAAEYLLCQTYSSRSQKFADRVKSLEVVESVPEDAIFM